MQSLLTFHSLDNIQEYQRQLFEIQNLRDNQTTLQFEFVSSEKRNCTLTGKCMKICFQGQNAKEKHRHCRIWKSKSILEERKPEMVFKKT